MCYGIFYFLKRFFWYELRIAINKVKHLEAAGIVLHGFMYVWLTFDTFFSFQPDLNLILFLTLIMIKESLDGLHGHMPSMSERKSNWLVFTCVFEFSEHLTALHHYKMTQKEPMAGTSPWIFWLRVSSAWLKGSTWFSVSRVIFTLIHSEILVSELHKS